MSKRLLLAADIGTSGCKTTAFDFRGNAKAFASISYNTCYSQGGCAEQDPNDWWKAVCEGIRKLLDQDGIDPREIAAVGVDGTSWACLPVDRKGSPLRKAMLWLDRRAVRQAEWMKEQAGEDRLIALSGNPVEPAYITPKILWVKENEPVVYKNTFKFLQSNAYIVFKLTGAFSQDYSQGYGFHFFDISRGSWDEDTAEELGIPLELTAKLCHCHEIVGTITAKAAEETGLIPGTPVAAGGLDAACCTLGAGVADPGKAQEQGGQAGGMSIQTDKPLVHPKLILGYHVIPNQWLLQGGTVGGGGALRWFGEQLGAYEVQKSREMGVSTYELMSDEAGVISPGCDGLIFLPYMSGERSPIWDSDARGVYFGLSYDKTRAHMIRAVMEGTAFSLLHNLETAEEVSADAGILNSVGGAANSEVWTQIKADVTGRIINVPCSDHATSLGAAILAGIGTGVYKSFKDAVQETVHIRRTHYPNEQRHRLYRGYYELYLELYEKLKESYKKLNMLANTCQV